MADVPTTVSFPAALPAERERGGWRLEVDGVDLPVSNLDKVFWPDEGYTKADLLAYYHNIAAHALPYLVDRPLTLKRMPDGAAGEFFYAKQAPSYTPSWMATAPVRSRDTGKTVDYLLARDRPSLLWLANLGCIELHPWHSRVDALGRPDYAFFDLDPFDVDFSTVQQVALLVRTVLDRLGLRGYPRTSGATGMQVYVPLDRVHSSGQVRDWVGRVCRLINRADPDRTTMEWSIAERSGKVFLDHNMNTEGKNIAATYSLRPERRAPVATPLRWDEVAGQLHPTDFTITTIFDRLAEVGDLFAPVLQGGQDLRAAMRALGMDPDEPPGEAGHEVTRAPGPAPRSRPDTLARYASKRDFSRTPEPAPAPPAPEREQESGGPRFVLQHHLATRLHHDLRFERDGTAPSWAVPKGLPDVPGLRHLAVQTEDHPLSYLDFSGEIPEGEYGAGPVRIWDRGTYEALEWRDDKVTFRLHGARHHGEWHLFRTDAEQRQWMVVRRGREPDDLPAPPPALAPMLAGSAEQPFDDPDWLFEVKWDGIRALATTGRPGAGPPGFTRLVTRAGNDVTAGYPELAPVWERVLARNAVVDGEIVAFDAGRPSFERLQQRMHVRDAAALERLRGRVPVSYVVFDLLALDGEPLVDRPLSERLARLDEVLVPGGVVQRSSPVAGDGRALFAAATERGLEGIVAKRAASVYRPGRRTRDWLKIKVRRRVHAVIGGWLPGEGRRSSTLGALLVGLYDEGGLAYVGRVGSGFDEAELARVGAVLAARRVDTSPFTRTADIPRSARWVSPDLVCEVEYADITTAGRLRAPVYKGLRTGVDPRRCAWDDR